MACMLLCDRLEELWVLIEQQHLGYLETDEHKGEYRARLESYMLEFLQLAPHDRKFNCSQTSQVLRRSVNSKEKFSGKNAARAWDAIAKYASNLVRHPWRKEFCDIKLYCGFYKHEIEQALTGAEQMFEVMGYRHTANSSMTLHGVLDPDRITSVSKDAILALVECKIMQQIWEAMSQDNITWSQVLEFRENHPGTPEQAIQALNYRVRERRYQERHSNCVNAGFYDSHAAHYQVHPHSTPRFAHIVSPQQVLPPPTMYQTPINLHYTQQHVLKPQDIYPTNGYHNHSAHTYYPPHNGYLPQAIPPYTYPHPSTVPTAQLIELESSPAHAPHRVANPYPFPVPEPVRTTDFPSTKAKDDGAGSWENWDYVYRTIGSHGYRKESASREFVTDQIEDLTDGLRYMTTSGKNRATTPPKRNDAKTRTEGDGEAKHRLSKNSIELEDVLPKNRPPTNPESTSQYSKTRIQKPTSLSEPAPSNKNKVGNSPLEHEHMGSVNDRVIYNGKSKSRAEEQFIVSLHKSTLAGGEVKKSVPERILLEEKHVVTLDVSPSFARESNLLHKPVVDLPPEEGKWECVTCTFLNGPAKNVCEMCGKSRMGGQDIQPQPCGGQECPKCTFVNEPGKNYCAVCQFDLKGSPIYI